MLGNTLGRRAGTVLGAALVAVMVANLSTVGQAVAAPTPPQPAPQAVGTWSLTPLAVDGDGAGSWRAEWSSPHRLPMVSDRPTIVGAPAAQATGWTISDPTYADDGDTVIATVVTDRTPVASDLDVVLSGRVLDDVRPSDPAGPSRTPRSALTRITDNPAAPGPYDIVRSDYTQDPVKLPGMKQPIEMVGHVVEPAPDAATGPRPLVLFLHGRHSVCYNPNDKDAYDDTWPCRAPFEEIPSHLGYDYMQATLASQGFATVSVRVNGINGQDGVLPDGGAAARAAIVRKHLDYWTTLATTHQLDMSQVVLVGHSRGGEGVDRASLQIGLDAPYTIVGQVLVAPTNFGHQTAAYVPTVTLLPGCDGDVSDLQGQQFTDVGRDLTGDDTSLKSSVYIVGANHNFFNTEWTPGIAVAPAWDDWGDEGANTVCSKKSGTRLTAAQQRSAGDGYVTAAVRLFTGDSQWLTLFDGDPVTATDAAAYSAAIGGDRDLRRPGKQFRLSLAVDAQTRFCNGIHGSRPGDCGSNMDAFTVPNWSSMWDPMPTKRFWEMAWQQSGATGGMLLNRPLDLGSRPLLLRTLVDPASGPVTARVRLTDGSGASAEVTDPATINPLPTIEWATKVWAQSLIVDPSGLSGVDLSDITQIELITATDHGRIWVADVAAAADTLPAVPHKRLPTISVGSAKVNEGNGREPVTYRLPLTVNGTLARPARINVVVATPDNRRPQSYRLDLAPGQTQASVPVSWQPNRVADYPRLTTEVAIQPVENLMTDAYRGGLTRIDDDPKGKFSVEIVGGPRITEGKPVVVKLKWIRGVGFDTGVNVSARKVAKPAASTADLPRAWRKAHYVTLADRPLANNLWLNRMWRTGVKSTSLRFPTLADGKREPKEAIRLRIEVGDVGVVTRTVYLVDKRR